MPVTKRFDILVIGGGHAGAEAAWAAANLGARAALVTMDPAKIGAMSCNPAIGGLAKGQMVREIDALGGLMGLAADATGIQFRMLNASKGPAVRGPRCQADKYKYARQVQMMLQSRADLTILAGTVDDLLVNRQGRCTGALVTPSNGQAQTFALEADAVVLTTGTFMRALMHTGERKTQGGRVDEASAVGISAALTKLGFELGRLKTGTPPRLAADSIDFASLELQPGDDLPIPFSDMTRTDAFPALPQTPCWITATNPRAHQAIMDNLDRAPMYNGQIDASSGPRYCPSIEDKVVRFADRASHHVFLEPESYETDEIYCNGISTSLPADVQDLVVRELPGCEKARILRYGYAVEYDMVWPHQIDATGMTKRVEGLFLAGQINGTSGYEEAAGQGLIAGLNAVRFARNESLIRLGREQAYLGVMLDDLVTKTPREPYRMFTSRAEHRLVLRADNADERLTALGRSLGLVDDARWQAYENRMTAHEELRQALARGKTVGRRMIDWIARQDVTDRQVIDMVEHLDLSPLARSSTVINKLLAKVKYAGYIERQQRETARLADLHDHPLPADVDYLSLTGLRNEARQTLDRFRPGTVGQASRLAGITPADLMVLTVAVGR